MIHVYVHKHQANTYFKIAPVTRIVRMAVLIAQIQFVEITVEQILRRKTKIIWKRAKMKKALI